MSTFHKHQSELLKTCFYPHQQRNERRLTLRRWEGWEANSNRHPLEIRALMKQGTKIACEQHLLLLITLLNFGSCFTLYYYIRKNLLTQTWQCEISLLNLIIKHVNVCVLLLLFYLFLLPFSTFFVVPYKDWIFGMFL